MKLSKKQNNVPVSSINLEGSTNIEWSLIVYSKDLSLDVEIPLELNVTYSRFDDATDQEQLLNKIIKVNKIKLMKMELHALEEIVITKIEIHNDLAKVFLGN